MADTRVEGFTVPDSPEAMEEFVADPKNWEKLAKEGPKAQADFLDSYKKLVNRGDAISRQIIQQTSEQSAALVTDWLKENGMTDRPDLSEMASDIARQINGPGGNGAPKTYNPRALGTKVDGLFENSGEFFQTIWHNTDRNDEVRNKLTALRNAFSEKVPSEGGFLVPERLRAELLRVALETSVVRSRARTIPMDSLRVPFPAVDDTSHASSVFGGIIGYWTQEGASITDTSPAFGQIVLEAKKLAAYTEAPNELVSDSISSFQTYIDELFPEALGWYEDLAFFEGSGAGEPEGFLNSNAAISITKETGQAADTIVWENIVKMYARMLPGSLGRAVWVANNDTFPELATMALSVGTGGSAIWLNNGAAGPPMTILGRPVVFTEKAATVGDAGDINFVDFGYYLIGDRQVMSASSSVHAQFQADKTAFRIIERVDGRGWLQSAITPVKGSNTLSPFVKVAARA